MTKKRKYAPEQLAYIKSVARCAAVQAEVERSMAQHLDLLATEAGVKTYCDLEVACEDGHGWAEAHEAERLAENAMIAWSRDRVMTDLKTAVKYAEHAVEMEHVYANYRLFPKIRAKLIQAALELEPCANLTTRQ